MKKLLTAALLLSLTSIALAEENPESSNPTAEKAFIASIEGLGKANIIERFGEPSKIEDIKTNDEKLEASIWQYHYLNTDEKGEYYQTTELDFINDKVVMIVFMNNDGSEVPKDAVSVPVPSK